MRIDRFLPLCIGILAWLGIFCSAEDPYRYFTWEVTYGQIAPLGVEQRGILINGQFPGPTIDCATDDNILVTVINKLDEPFLFTWNGIKQRKTSWQDGVLGTNCPIPPNSEWQYKMQMKDQVGTFSYFPSTLVHRASGGYGGLNIAARSVVFVPYLKPVEEFTVLISDWWNADHKTLQQRLDAGTAFPFPDGLLINGLPTSARFTGAKGNTYLFRVSNLALATAINVRIQEHKMKLVEVEGSHTVQDEYNSLDIHVGQALSFLVELNGRTADYYIVVSSRFTNPIITATAVLHYEGSSTPPSGPLPVGPSTELDLHWSMKQARSIRWNLTANAARPNPQGSFHYGSIKPTRTIVLANSAPLINGKLRYAVNRVSYINSITPLKLADYFNIPGVLDINAIEDFPSEGPAFLSTSVMPLSHHDFIEVVFQNNENAMQSWHLDGYDFWVVGIGSGQWSQTSRSTYNLVDALTRHTTQVYPSSWTAILVSLDNQGMWNIRSAIWERQYLGQQFYLRVFNPVPNLSNEYDIPSNVLLCGKAADRH